MTTKPKYQFRVGYTDEKAQIAASGMGGVKMIALAAVVLATTAPALVIDGYAQAIADIAIAMMRAFYHFPD
jgi:hypothetical protein